MKPLRLAATAFGPFGASIDIDFDRLAGLGLFVVSGDTGAGKTSVFDAMFYALYGELPGDRHRHHHIRSDHATPDCECEVTFEFLAGGDIWQIVRKPSQTRAKKRGGGLTTVSASAALSRRDGDAWEPVSAGVQHVDKQIRPLVGLTPAQFERVVLLPQGHFRRVLDATSAEREKLLRTLFGSEMFDTMSTDLRADAQRLSAACREQRQERDSALRRIAATLATLEDEESEPSNVRYLGSVGGPIPEPASTVDDDEAPVPTIEHLRNDIERLDADLLGPLRAGLALSETSVEQARTEAERAVRDHQLLTARAKLLDEQARLDAERPVWDAARAAVARARQVEPANQAVRARDQHHVAHESSRQDLVAAIASANRALQDAGVAHTLPASWVVDAQSPSADSGDAAASGSDEIDPGALDAAVDVGLAELEQRDRDLAELRKHVGELERIDRAIRTTEAEAQRVSAAQVRARASESAMHERTADLAAQREALGLVAMDVDNRTRHLHDLQKELEQRQALVDATEALDVASAELLGLTEQSERLAAYIADHELAALGDTEATNRITTLTAQLSELAERQQQHRRFTGLSERERDLAKASQQANDRSASVYAAFLADTAPQLAERLIDGEPCPVCGSAEHPAPATASEGDVDSAGTDSAAVVAAAADAEAAVVALSQVRAELTVVVGALDSAPVAPEELVVERHRLESDLATAQADKEAAAAARTEVEAANTRRSALDVRLVEARQRHTSAQSHRERVRGAVTDDSVDLSTLQSHLDTASAALDEARAANEQLQTIDAEEQTLLVESAAVRTELADLERQVAQHEVELHTHHSRATDLQAQVQAIGSAHDLTSSTAAIVQARDLLHDVRDRSRNVWQSGREAARLSEVAAAALATAGYGSAGEAAAAAMPEPQIEQKLAELAQWEEQEQRCRTELSLSLQHNLPAAAPDIDAARAALSEATHEHRTLLQRLTVTQDRLTNCGADLDRIADRERSGADQVAAADAADRVARVVSGDNDQRMSLEGWVLAAHLRRVVEHANVHLESMCAGRYRLAVDTQPADQRGRHGLDLVVDDAFTGATRPTRSLSGGESFQASLALALGLGDVVCSQRSSLHIDAIFIDEGFGTLDAGSVDQAIDVLDSLRSSGATIGVITHVDAVKAALPTGLQVVRTEETGSTVCHAA